MQEFLPVTWYWYVNGNGVINVKDSASSTQHKLIIGKDITAIKSHKTSEDIINYFVLWNARSTVDLSYVYVTNTDATSKTNYGTHTLFQADSAILSDAIADIRKDKVIEYNKNPTEEITIEVTDEYDIASIEPGDRVSIRNIKTDSQTTFADDLVVVKISYTVNSALIELGALGSNLTKFSNEESNAFEVALKQVYGIQTGGIALTEANIEYGGESFIKKNIIYAPIIAGTTGYFKESIRMGDSGVGSVIRTYGKTGFGDLSSGIWIEKNSSEDIYFELYKDSSNFLRFNTSTGKLEIAGDIVMSVGSTITWAQISDTVVPNTDALSSFDNDDGWTLGATWNSNISGQPSDGAITNPSYITATKITATTIETPTITAGTITGTIVQTSGTANTGVKMSSILGGIDIYGQTMDFKDTSGNLFGYIYGSGSFNILASAGRNLVLSAGSYLYFNPTGNFVIPNNDNDLYLGASTTSSGGSFGSDKTWKYVGAQVIDAKDKYKLNDNDVIDQSGSTMYIKSGGGGGLVLQDGSTTIATFSVAGGLDVAAGKDLDSQYSHLDCVVFGNNSPLTENGTIYFNGTHFYGRIAGAWKQLDN